jgi:hypothetical protein
MPFVPVPQTVLAEVRMLFASQKIENTLWFDLGVTPGPTDMLALANGLVSWWINDYAPLVSIGVQLREVVVTDESSATGPQVSFSPTTPAFGANTSAVKPSNAAATISFRTGSRGRSFRGRNYIPGLTQDTLSGNTLQNAFMDDAIAAYEQLLPGGTAEFPGTWVVASRFHGVDADKKPIPRTTGIATPITNVVIVDNTVDSQRRRLPGRGQ